MSDLLPVRLLSSFFICIAYCLDIHIQITAITYKFSDLERLYNISDRNNDNFVDELEALTNVNKAVVWKWTHEIEIDQSGQLLKKLRGRGLTRDDIIKCIGKPHLDDCLLFLKNNTSGMQVQI